MYVYTRIYAPITILVPSQGYGVGVDVQQHLKGVHLYTYIRMYIYIYAYICSYHYTCARSRLYIRVYMLNADAIGVDVQQHLKGAHRAIGARVGVRQDIVHW